ncbi:MAG: SAF domain-containing protein [Microbacteriaceae bacterium]
MSYTARLIKREADTGKPIRVGVVGAGQMGRGLIAQIHNTQGMTVSVVADIETQRAVDALKNAGVTEILSDQDFDSNSKAILAGKSVVLNNGTKIPELPVDIVLEVSGVPDVAAEVALASLLKGKHVALMTVEADVTVGWILAQIAESGNAVYTVCRGDEPVEALKLFEYAQDIGLEVIVAGKGKNNPLREDATPESLTEEALSKGMNPKMLCSFVDGTKTMVEMAALANATGLAIDVPGMHGAAINLDELDTKLRPVSDGGIITQSGVVEYVTGDVAPGVFVIVKANNPVVHEELDYLKLGHGPFYKLYRPYHLASIEATLSISEAVLDDRASLKPVAWTAEVVTKAKRDLKAGESIDGIGGSTVFGYTVSASDAREARQLPIGIARGAKIVRDIAKGEVIGYDDVELDDRKTIIALRKLQDAMLASR